MNDDLSDDLKALEPLKADVMCRMAIYGETFDEAMTAVAAEWDERDRTR